MTKDEMVGWHHRLDGHGFGWTPGVGDGQGDLACCSSWGRRVGHNCATELKRTEPPGINVGERRTLPVQMNLLQRGDARKTNNKYPLSPKSTS